MPELPITTSETDFAVHLIQSGFTLLGINYEPRSNGRKRGIFVFAYDSRIKELQTLYENNKITVKLCDMDAFKEIKSGLLDRVMNGRP